MMTILLGNKEHVAGWCFEGRASADQLVRILTELLEFVGIDSEEYVIDESSDAIRVAFPSVVGTSYRFSLKYKDEERVRILLITAKKFTAYEVGKFLKEKLDMLMVGRGYFTY